MNARHLLAAPLVAAAVSGPYLATEDEWRRWLPDSTGAPSATAPPELSLPPAPSTNALPVDTIVPGSVSEAPTAPASELPPFDATGARFAGPPVADFSEVLRFDVTPEWIFTRWARVNTITADQALQGFRAPLVTGTRVDDLAGVVTYYFGRHGRLQRVSFEGRTGDTRRLTAFLTQNYGFQAKPNLGAGLYLVTWNARPMSGLRVDYAPVVRADAPHLRYTLKLEINRPDEAYSMSEEFQRILSRDQETKRWLPY